MDSTENLNTHDSSTDDPSSRWHAARKITKNLGAFPVTFTTPIRVLLYDARSTGRLSPATQFLATRLLRSATTKAVFYYGALTFHGDRISQSAYLSSADLIRLYNPRDCAAIIALIYLYRRLLNLAAHKLPNWVNLAKQITLRAELAGHLGQAIPALGRATTLFAGCGRQLGIATLGLSDLDQYRKYLKHLELTGRHYDLEFEIELWGCTHVEVVSNALQLLGLGPERAHAYNLGMSNSVQARFEEQTLAFEHTIAEEWIDALSTTKQEPNKTHLGQYYPVTQEMHRLLYEVNKLFESGSKYIWLDKSKNDINPLTTPQLFQELLMELEQTGAIADFYKDNLPEEIMSAMTPEELEKISKSRYTENE